MAAKLTDYDWTQDLSSFSFTFKTHPTSASKIQVTFYASFVKVNFDEPRLLQFVDLHAAIDAESAANSFSFTDNRLSISCRKAKPDYWPSLFSNKSKQQIKEDRELSTRQKDEYLRAKEEQRKKAKDDLIRKVEDDEFKHRER